MTEYQLSSKYPDGTIAVAKGDAPDAVVGSFIAFKQAYESESGTKPFPVPATTTSYEQGVANAQVLTQPQAPAVVQPSAPPPPGAARPGDGELHPTKTCGICHAPRKVVDRPKKDGGGQYRKLECSVDYKHKPDDWSENYK